ncbi:hypothetical protein INS49_006720 [Diaporthe citri]|uniref:uncharacterized protein n=1 Tax=Diaporthe citri TaxID=83186 RepID=UPI001C7E4556|nr:uncharacterized protein INS49_006720 [Diaporthe citri]KAG6365113.1 hypothetical protein INS49_006720 [Diaporthe citri]
MRVRGCGAVRIRGGPNRVRGRYPVQAGSENSDRVHGAPDAEVDDDPAEVELEDVAEVFVAVEDDSEDTELAVDEFKLVEVAAMGEVELLAVRVTVEKPDHPLGRYVGSDV